VRLLERVYSRVLAGAGAPYAHAEPHGWPLAGRQVERALVAPWSRGIHDECRPDLNGGKGGNRTLDPGIMTPLRECR
jgi:hypothetical protein